MVNKEMVQESFIDEALDKEAKAKIQNGNWSRFCGRILPETPAFSLELPFHVIFEGLSGIQIAMEVSLADSQIFALCLSNETHLPTLRNYVTDQVQLFIDVVGFTRGFRFDVDIRSAVVNGGKFTSFSTIYPALAATVKDRPINDLELLPLCKEDSALVLALGDLRNAMRSASDSGLFCYRAVESIMQSFKKPTDKDERKVWQKMNDALKIEYSFTNSKIKDFADARRHGSGSFITGAQRDDCMVACATIIFRFAQFLKAGRQDLPLSQFPTLK